MSILNVNTIQPVGSGQTITVSATNISAPSTVVTASSFVGNVTGNVTGNLTGNVTGNLTGNVTGISTLGVTTAYISQLAGVGAGTSIQIPSGSKLVGLTTGSVSAPGSIIQVVQTVYKGTQSITTNLDGITSISELDCTITPTSTSSKILISLVLHVSIYYYQCRGVFFRNSTQISDAKGTVQGTRPGAAFNMIRYGSTGAASSYDIDIVSSQYLDSPSSTSALTYGVGIGGFSNSHPLYVNRSAAFGDVSGVYDAIPISTMTLFEISA